MPVIAREAYFTAALFGASSKAQDGREKKRNFENTKKSVDHLSQHFRYYVQRTCGIIEESPRESSGRLPPPDAMLSLVASIHLNEAMENYIDCEQKYHDMLSRGAEGKLHSGSCWHQFCWRLGFLESICIAILIGVSLNFLICFCHAYKSHLLVLRQEDGSERHGMGEGDDRGGEQHVTKRQRYRLGVATPVGFSVDCAI